MQAYWKETRTGLRALTTFGRVFKHDMIGRFPLLTTKKMAYKSIWVELEGFIKGITSKKWYQERNCNIWNEWSNPTNDEDNDLGPIYGYQWRRFNEIYDENDNLIMTAEMARPYRKEEEKDITFKLKYDLI